MSAFDSAMERFFANLSRLYERALSWSLRHKKTVVFSVLGLFAVAVLLLGRVGFEFMPKTDDNEIDFNVELPVGTALPATDIYFKKIESLVVNNVPELENINVNFGSRSGFAAISGGNANSGRVSLSLVDKTERRRSKFDIQDELREKINNIPGVRATFASGGFMGGGSDISIEVYGYDLNEAELVAENIRDRIRNIPGVVDIDLSFSDPQPEYTIRIDREKAGKMGLSVAAISQVVETAVKGRVASVYREKGNEYDVHVQLGREFRESEQDIRNIFLKTPAGDQVPISAIASVVETTSPVSIERKDQNRLVTIDANVSGRDLGSVTDQIEKEIATVPMPADFRTGITGAAEDLRETVNSFFLAILIAVFLVYMVMASQFESLLDPFIIIFTIPLALIGVAFSLFITNTTLNTTSLIGSMVLVGIVVNNGIVLIDYINRLIRERKKHVTEAIIEGSGIRLRPILMTALTTILSMTPLALEFGSGAELWGPMARTIIGGLIASTFLTLFFVPILFDTLQHKRMEQKLKVSCSDDEPVKE
jgi:HAE1 family hydrophobic/amphiphilic exporter-1